MARQLAPLVRQSGFQVLGSQQQSSCGESLVSDNLEFNCDSSHVHVLPPVCMHTQHTQVLELYEQGAAGLSWGVSTGWSSVDAFYKVRWGVY